MKAIVNLCLLLAISGLTSASLFAEGVAVKVEQTGVNPDENSAATYLFDRDNMKMEFKGANEHNIVIFFGKESKLVFADLKEGVKTEITQADLQKINTVGKQVQPMQDQYLDAMKQVREKLRGLPEDQRKLAEQYMQLPQMSDQETPAANTTYKLVDDNVLFNNWHCKKYEGYKNGQKTKVVLTADYRELGISADDFKVLDKFAEFIENLGDDLVKKMSANFKVGSADWEKKKGYSGVPVKTEVYEHGQAAGVSITQEIAPKDFSEADFTLPENLKLENLFDKLPKFGK